MTEPAALWVSQYSSDAVARVAHVMGKCNTYVGVSDFTVIFFFRWWKLILCCSMSFVLLWMKSADLKPWGMSPCFASKEFTIRGLFLVWSINYYWICAQKVFTRFRQMFISVVLCHNRDKHFFWFGCDLGSVSLCNLYRNALIPWERCLLNCINFKQARQERFL